MLDVPLQLLIGGAATVLFAQRGDRFWPATGKGAIVSVGVTTVGPSFKERGTSSEAVFFKALKTRPSR